MTFHRNNRQLAVGICVVFRIPIARYFVYPSADLHGISYTHRPICTVFRTGYLENTIQEFLKFRVWDWRPQ